MGSPKVKAARLLLLGSAGLGLAASPSPRPAHERAIIVPQPGKVFVALDRFVYEEARVDLADLRILDEAGSHVPFLLEEFREDPDPNLRQPRFLKRRFVRGESASVTLDFGDPLLKSGLVLSLSGQSFRRRIMVEGRNKHERAWATLTDSAYVVAIPGPSPARYETVSLPENNDRYLRLTAFHDPDDPGRIEFLQVWARPEGRRRARELSLVPAQLTQAEIQEQRETHITVDLGARHQPFRALAVDVTDREFFRGVVLEGLREGGGMVQGRAPPPISWAKLGHGSLYRTSQGQRLCEQLRVDISGRERVVRLRIANLGDRPLEIRDVRVMAPLERLVFSAGAGRSYRLTYGVPELGPAEYDIQKTVRDPAVWIAQAIEGALAPPVRNVSPPQRIPWTKRHPRILWGGLVAIVALLGSITWRAFKSLG